MRILLFGGVLNIGGFEITLGSLLLLLVAAFLAGFIDAVVGGGGLIQLPVLLLMPGITPVQALATNKLASVFGTATSSLTYYRKVRPDLSVTLSSAIVALIAAIFGASVAVILPAEIFQWIILIALIIVLLFTLLKPSLGLTSNPKHKKSKAIIVAIFIGLVIGFYDGLLGPGTGSFLVIAFVGLLGLNFLEASASAKIVNFATNIGALLLFIPHGVVLWGLGLIMAVSNITGSFIGSKTAMAKGNKFIRAVFLSVVTALIIKLALDFFVA